LIDFISPQPLTFLNLYLYSYKNQIQIHQMVLSVNDSTDQVLSWL